MLLKQIAPTHSKSQDMIAIRSAQDRGTANFGWLDSRHTFYEQKTFTEAEKRGTLRLVGSRDGRDGSITIHQNVDLYAATLNEGNAISHTFANGRVAWLQVARGAVQLNGQTLTAGDGATIAQESQITLQGASNTAEVLLFDMAA